MGAMKTFAPRGMVFGALSAVKQARPATDNSLVVRIIDASVALDLFLHVLCAGFGRALVTASRVRFVDSICKNNLVAFDPHNLYASLFLGRTRLQEEHLGPARFLRFSHARHF